MECMYSFEACCEYAAKHILQDRVAELPRGRHYAIYHDLEVWPHGNESLEGYSGMVQVVFL